MSNQNNFFSTQSLALASAVQAISTAKLELVEFHNSDRRAIFLFDRDKDPSFDEIVQRFWAKSLPIDASTYFDAQRQVKARLYEEQNART